MTRINLTANNAPVCLVSKMSRQTISAMSNGRMQYPSTQTLWKNDLQQEIIKHGLFFTLLIACEQTP